MDVQSDFYLTCTNESRLYGDNTIYRFRSRINPPMDLRSGQWEVGLSRLIMPQNQQMYIPSSSFNLTIKTMFDTLDIVITKADTFASTMDGFLESLQDAINEMLTEIFNSLRVGNSFYRSGGQIRVTKSGDKVQLSDITFKKQFDSDNTPKATIEIYEGLPLWHSIGFTNLSLNTPQNLPLVAADVANPPYVGSTMALHAPNLVVPERFADRFEPLLDLLPYNITDEQEYYILEEPRPLYKRVIGGYISELQFVLADIQGKTLRLATDKIQLVLHFRPCQGVKSQKLF